MSFYRSATVTLSFKRSILSDDHPLRTLRLLCLLSVASDGVTQNELHSIQKLHLHAHGYKHVPLFYKLQTIGLLKCRTENILHKLPNWSSEWNGNAQKLRLLPSYSKQTEQKGRTCPSYVFNNAYIPLIVSIIFELSYSPMLAETNWLCLRRLKY